MRLTTKNIRTFRRIIRDWGRRNLRDFPWRHTDDPYEVAIAELMLRRTQAEQVVPTYEEFLERYPTPGALTEADPEEVHEVLRRLGLAWRAQNILEFGQTVVDDFDGKVPTSAADLRKLPGVGSYVSAATRCFAAGQPAPIIDTNTVRVVGRVFGISQKGEARRRKEMKTAIQRCLDRNEPRVYNFALLDFASRICTAKSAKHARCAFSKWRRCGYYVEECVI
jgi:A/G-specific adenine glycosylase